MAIVTRIKFFNTFINKKVVTDISGIGAGINSWPGLVNNPNGYPTYPNGSDFTTALLENQWVIEESRIFGGYNNTIVTPGVKAYINEDNINQTRRFNSLIYSGVFNSKTDVNDTNVFSLAENIGTSCDPSYGSINLTKSYDTNIIVFQSDKVSQLLVDKDIIYTSESGTATKPPGVVLGQLIPYSGDYGISDDGSSFADFGFRKYFTDSWRGVVLRLSRDGLTTISNNGMKDYFRDRLSKISSETKRFNVGHTTASSGNLTSFILAEDSVNVEIGMGLTIDNIQQSPTVVDVNYTTDEITLSSSVNIPVSADLVFYKLVKDKIIGGYDVFDDMYVVSINNVSTAPNIDDDYNTLSFDETVKGWNSFYTYNPTNIFSLKNTFFSTKNGQLWRHNNETNSNGRGYFYGIYNSSYIDFLFNEKPSSKKVFSTVSYEGNNGFKVSYINSDPQEFDTVSNSSGGFNAKSFWDKSNTILSYEEGLYTTNGFPQRAGFDRKENLYVANLVNNSSVRPGEIIYGSEISGIKGYFTRVKIETDSSTDVGGYKELWSVSTNYHMSS